MPCSPSVEKLYVLSLKVVPKKFPESYSLKNEVQFLQSNLFPVHPIEELPVALSHPL